MSLGTKVNYNFGALDLELGPRPKSFYAQPFMITPNEGFFEALHYNRYTKPSSRNNYVILRVTNNRLSKNPAVRLTKVESFT